MNQQQFLLILVGLIVVLTVSVHAKDVSYMIENNPKCTQKRLEQTEMAVAKMIGFGKHGRKFPDTYEKISLYCKETTRLVAQTESFTKECIRKDVADLLSVILYSVKSHLIRQYCGKSRTNKRVTSMVRTSPCVNEHLLPNDHCVRQFINSTIPLITLEKDNMKIPYTCCNYVKTMGCFEKMIESQTCLKQHRERIIEIIKGLFNGVTDIMCGEYNEGTDKCEKLPPIPRTNKVAKRNYQTFMFLLADVLSSSKGFKE
ncbi:hypothetical protein BLOT_003375 [Blomia tropicalis]|nr:hypothetical protein BLOT_003375 [Blomia tropicalis]